MVICIFTKICATILFQFFFSFQTRVSGDSTCSPLASAVCGSFAGGIAAALTTPLDVTKTRIILMQQVSWKISLFLF